MMISWWLRVSIRVRLPSKDTVAGDGHAATAVLDTIPSLELSTTVDLINELVDRYEYNYIASLVGDYSS